MNKLQLAFDYLVRRFQEASTLRAVFILMGGSAALMNPEKAEAYLALAGVFAGLVGIFLPDTQPKE